MPDVIVCYKWVVDEADIRVNADLSVDFSKAQGKISDYDRNAIETAVQAKGALGGKAIGLTFGDEGAKQSLKGALSRGLDTCYHINAQEAVKADGAVTARALAAALRKMESVGLVICAEGASDTYARQTAPRIGSLLDLPIITSVIKIQIVGNTLTAVRMLADSQQTVDVQLPAVISVLPVINQAPIPGLKAVMSAGKKPVAEFKAGDLEVDLEPKSAADCLKGYAMNRKNVILNEGEPAEKVDALVTALRKEGVL